ncbi:MAG: coiled coil domain-containing protein [Desulfobulbaceae bacterium]|jgi:peptidoglycan hydrolase CwlO-like protein|nr:coiled coil domain-containing protein [Desulfobulbaceae bacterium]
MSMKEAYQQKLEAQLAEWNVAIDKLKAKADKAEAEAQIEYYKEIEGMRAKQEAAREKLTELKEAGEGGWEDLKVGLENTWNSLGDAVK